MGLNEYDIKQIEEKKTALVGTKCTNKCNETATIVDYINTFNITLMLDNGYKFNTYQSQLNKHNWQTPYSKVVCNLGYHGVGKYDIQKDKVAYSHWLNMFKRCYATDYSKKSRFRAYKDCTICEEWHNFQNFAQWYYDNMWECDQILSVDKDILQKGNKIYSPTNCVLVTTQINNLFIKSDCIRGKYPIGVSKEDNRKSYRVKLKSKMVGSFPTIEEAFLKYKELKEKDIKNVADEYKRKYPQFPQKLYDAMYNYQVDITD